MAWLARLALCLGNDFVLDFDRQGVERLRVNVQVRELQAEQARLLLTARQRERVARGLAGVAGAALTTGIAYVLF